MKKIGLSTPLGGIEYQWEKQVKDPKTDDKTIKNVMESFLICLEMGQKVSAEEIEALVKSIRDYGHLARFKDEEKEKFKTLLGILEEITEKNKGQFSKFCGIWKAMSTIRSNGNRRLLILRILDEDTADMEIQWVGSKGYPNHLKIDFEVVPSGDQILLVGREVQFQRRGDCSEKNFAVENYVLKVSPDLKKLKGVMTNVVGESEIEFEKISLE